MEKKKPYKKSFRIYLSIVAVLLLLQVIAWNSKALSDAYIAYIFPIWINTYGRIRDIPFFCRRMDDRGRASGGTSGNFVGRQHAVSPVQTFRKVSADREGIFSIFCLDIAGRIYHYDPELHYDLSWFYVFGEIFR